VQNLWFVLRGKVVAAPLGGSLLRVEPVKAARDDDTAVECVAENGIGEPASATARLHVYRDRQGPSAVHTSCLCN